MTLLDIRIVGEPEAAALAVEKLQLLFDLDRQSEPYPSRKQPGLVRYYLTGRLCQELAGYPVLNRLRLTAVRHRIRAAFANEQPNLTVEDAIERANKRGPA